MDWNEACLSCGQRCCRGERLFLTDTDHIRIRNFFVCTAGQETCPQLCQEGCRIYDHRPIECMLFPLGFEKDEEGIWLVLWNCPAAFLVDEAMIQSAILLPKSYAEQYVEHYRDPNMVAEKYKGEWRWTKIRQVV